MSSSSFIIPTTTKINAIRCTSAFNSLSAKEKLYAYFFTRASWAGSKSCYFEKSYESPALFYMFQKILAYESPSMLRASLLAKGVSDSRQVDQLFTYIAAFFDSCGNYKSFGDSKFIPQLDREAFWLSVQNTLAYVKHREDFEEIWAATNYEVYSTHNPYQIIDLPDKQGLSSYYSSTIDTASAEMINRFLEQNEISVSPLNTRVLRHSADDFEVLVASSSKQLEQSDVIHTFEGVKVRISYGDLSPFMQQVNENLALCIAHCENNHQVEMIKAYLKHFTSGSIEDHKDSQRHWIKDKGPVIETNIGFVESYLDPLKVRAEFEGFVAIVNKAESAKLEKLVERAEDLIKYMPWPRDFEVEKFTKPDFTSLEVLTFASSGIPMGINIPNYDDIRMTEGFKNVDLANVYGAPSRSNIPFVAEELKDLYCKHYKSAGFALVALHELLGHGSGKLFQKSKEGVLNFELGRVEHPLLKTPVTTFYEANETWHSKFGDISSAYEECKADSVALYLSCFPEFLEILMPSTMSEEERDDVQYILWYFVALDSLQGLEYFNPELKKWGQAHSAAEYAATAVMIEAGLVRFQEIPANETDSLPNVILHLDRALIKTKGKEAIGKFLECLQVYKSIGDVEAGTAFFEKYIEVSEDMLRIREITLSRKPPRKLSLLSGVKLVEEGENVEIVEFEETIEGVLESFKFHYQGQVDDVLPEWRKYQNLFRLKRQQ